MSLSYIKYRRFKNPKISNIFGETFVLSIACDKFCSIDKKVFKEEELIEILKIIVLINNMKE